MTYAVKYVVVDLYTVKGSAGYQRVITKGETQWTSLLIVVNEVTVIVPTVETGVVVVKTV